jgi:hypothetical protein
MTKRTKKTKAQVIDISEARGRLRAERRQVLLGEVPPLNRRQRYYKQLAATRKG